MKRGRVVHSGQTGAIGRDAHIWKSARCGAPIFVFLLTRSTALYDRERSGPPAKKTTDSYATWEIGDTPPETEPRVFGLRSSVLGLRFQGNHHDLTSAIA